MSWSFKMRFFAGIILAAFSALSFAGDKGNMIGPRGSLFYTPKGYAHGEAIVCRDKNFKVKNAYLLEYAELDGIKGAVTTYDDGINDYEFIMGMADILEPEAPDLFHGFKHVGTRIAGQAMSFMVNGLPLNVGVTFNSNEPFLEANSAKISKLPKDFKDCRSERVVMGQKTYSGVIFTVNADIFVKLSKRDRRGLIFHEALFYSIQRYYGDVDSARTRYVHQRLIQYDRRDLTGKIISDILSKAYLNF